MARTKKLIPEEKIQDARKFLRSIEPKITGKTREEAYDYLEEDIKRAYENGYTIKELSDLLKEECEIHFPVQFLKKYSANSTPHKERKPRRTNRQKDELVEASPATDISSTSSTNDTKFGVDTPLDEL